MTDTPRATRPPKPPKKKRRWLRRILWTVLTLALLGVAGLVIAYVATPIPKANERALQQNSIIYYSDGHTVLDRFSTVNRQTVPLSRVPEQVQKAFLAAEDRTFYTNSGISPKGIARSIWVGLKGGETQGGSTITQQYVKNYYLSQERTLTRKFKEIMISIKIDKEVPKDQILEDYLNTIYFGRGADGIQTAAQTYFGKGVQDLDVAQGALLASVIRGPSYYDPQLGPEQKTLAEGRWNYVLDGMVSQGWLTQAERSKLTFPETRPLSKSTGLTGPNGFVSEAVREELKSKLKLTDTDLALGGLRIVTTIDRQAQDAALSAIQNGMPTGPGTDTLHVGLAGRLAGGVLEGVVEDVELGALGLLDPEGPLGTGLALELLPVAGDLEEDLDGLGRLRADAQPVLRPLGGDLDQRGVLLGVVLADLLDHLAVALLAGVDDDDAVLRHPDLAQALQTDLDGHVCGVSSKVVCG